jgi:hypothetical protein
MRKIRRKYRYKMLTDEQVEALINQGHSREPVETLPELTQRVRRAKLNRIQELTKTANKKRPVKVTSSNRNPAGSD